MFSQVSKNALLGRVAVATSCFAATEPSRADLPVVDYQEQPITTTICSSSSTESFGSPTTDPSFYKQSQNRQIHSPKTPYPAWDYNWDDRMSEPTSFESLRTLDGYKASKATGTTRHIIMIRHGQYDMSNLDDDSKCVLTALGRRQALRTGQRLALLTQQLEQELTVDGITPSPIHIKAIYQSDMARAKETARIIASQLPNVELFSPDPMLNEGLPAPIIPIRPDVPDAEREIGENQQRVEEAFQKYFWRAVDNENAATTAANHEFEVIVGHANIIRYFVCRSLQLPPEAWLRMSIFNCSITYIMIQPNGYVTIRSLGDTGHLPYEETSFSGNRGWNWA